MDRKAKGDEKAQHTESVCEHFEEPFNTARHVLRGSIGIMGGTFDPVHHAHLQIAWELSEQLHLDEVRFIPSNIPVHRKEPHASPQHRLNMLTFATQSVDKFLVDDREIQRKGPSYMIDTLKSLQTDYPQAQLHLFLGMDAFNELPTWKDWEQLVDYAKLIVVRRPSYVLPSDPAFRAWSAEQQTKGSILFAQTLTSLDISASLIRKALREHKSPRYLLPDAVLNYITENKLYGGD